MGPIEPSVALLSGLLALIFFVLGMLYRIVSEFRVEMSGRMDRLTKLMFRHSHTEEGTAFIPRK